MMEIKPILIAQYLAGFQTPEFSGGWGQWQQTNSKIPAALQHDPARLLGNGERDIASVYMPVIGPYDSGDPDVIEYHMLLAKTVGIEGFIINWFGPFSSGQPEMINYKLQTIFKVAETLNFKLALCLEDAACFPPLQNDVTSRADAMAQAAKIIKYAETEYFSSPAYLKVAEHPILGLKNCGQTGVEWNSPFFNASEWDEILSGSQSPVWLIQNYQPQRKNIEFSEWASVYPWLSIYFSDYDTDENFWGKSREAIDKNRFRFISGLVNPGFDDRGIGGDEQQAPRVFSRRQGEKYTSTWEDNLRHGAQIIQIGTWNDHNQGTGIEPVKEIVLHKNAAVPGWGYRELITTREYAVRFTKQKLWTLPALFLPERLYHLRKSGAPASRADRIRLYMMEGDITGASLGLEHAGV